MGVNKVIYNGQVLIDLTSSTVTPETLLEGTIAFNSAGEQIVGTLVISGGFTNQVPISINADGTIYNGVGYKEGYRVRSGGTEVEYNATCTGFIPVKAGDIVRTKGWNFKNANNGNALNVSDDAFTNIGQASMGGGDYGIFTKSAYKNYGNASIVEETTGVYKWVVPPASSGVAYIRISGYGVVDGSTMIVTVNEEIK